MTCTPCPHRRMHRRGSTAVIVLILIVLMTMMAVGFSATTSMSFHQAKNHRDVQAAQWAAESGLSFMLDIVARNEISPIDAKDDLLLAVADDLVVHMDGTANIGVAEIVYTGSKISVPTIALDGRQQFRAEIVEAGTDLRLTVYGTANGTTRKVSILVTPVPHRAAVFDYGIASKGRIIVGGDGTVVGVNDPHEADILSATYSDPLAIEVAGSCQIDGDLSTSNPASTISIAGNPSIAGLTKTDPNLADHLHIGVGEVAFPEVDPSIFKPFATNVLDSSTDLTGLTELENITIKANTNPIFNANMTLRGVVYIEVPNQVKFNGNAQLVGTIVTEDAGEGGWVSNYLEFKGDFSSSGVESLPDQPQFATLRTMTGSAILAPGFAARMTGSMGAINGMMVADQFTVNGNASGAINGSILCYGDTEFSIWGSSQLQFDRSDSYDMPAGFLLPVTMEPVANSYSEQ